MKSNKRSFLQRLRFKYKIFILNENTLEETFHIRLSRLTVYMYIGFFTLISFAIISAIILLTPLKHFLPGYADVAARSELIKSNLQVDSLMNDLALQNYQLDMIMKVIEGSAPVDTITVVDSVKYGDWSQLMLDPSESEEAFRLEFEEKERYNLGTLKSSNLPRDIEIQVFYKPIRGVLLKPYSKEGGDKGITLVTSPQEGVLASLPGTVISTDYSFRSGYTMIIQHDDGFITVYKHLGRLMKQAGDTVKAGEVIGIVSDSNDPTSEPILYYELWQNGKVLNPLDYIIF